MGVRHLALSLHKSVEDRLQRRHIMRNGTGTVLVACDSHKAVGRSRKVYLQTVCPVVDVIDGLVKDIVCIDFEESTQASAGRGPLKICVFEDSKHGSCHIIQRTVLPDAVVNVNRSDARRNPDADPIPTAHGVDFHGIGEIGEGVRVIGLCLLMGSRFIGNLCQSGGFCPTLHLPDTKPAGVFKLCRDVYKIYSCTCSIAAHRFTLL